MRKQIPDRDHGADVDLLRLVTEAPPDDTIPNRIGLARPTHRVGERRDHHNGTMQQRDDRDDGGGQRTESDDGHGALVGAIALGDIKRGEEVEHADQRAHSHENDAEVECRMREQRQVGCHQYVRLSGENHPIHHHGANSHERKADPGHLAREESRVERRGAGEVKDRDFKEEDPENEHVDAVESQHAVEPVHGQQMHGLPAREREQQCGDAAEQQEDDADDSVHFDETLGVEADAEAGGGANALRCVGCGQRMRTDGQGGGDRGHEREGSRGYSTKILPVMAWCPMPQNSLQTMVNSPFEVGVRVRMWS